MRRIKLSIIILVSGFFLCTYSPPQCLIYVSPELKSFAVTFLSRNPLPGAGKVILTYTDPKAAAITLTQRTGEFKIPPKGSPERILERQWLAPVALLWEETPDKEKGLVPLEDIALPLRGMAAGGLFPGQAGYPYCRETVITLNTAADELVRHWFRNLPADDRSTPLVWIGAVGDLMPGRGLEGILQTQGLGIDAVFGDTRPLLLAQDLLLGNLEGAVTGRTEYIPKSYNFKFTNDLLYFLKQVGFDYLCLANNHSFDYGLNGFVDTLQNFSAYNLPTSGVGMNLAEAKKPWHTLINRQDINIISMAAFAPEVDIFHGQTRAVAAVDHPGMLWEGEETFRAIKEFASEKSFDIVMIHAGEEYVRVPNARLKRLYKRLVDAGADAVLAAHPHVLQGMEAYHGKLIAYSLGNFIFPEIETTPYAYQSLILRIGVYESRIIYVEPVGVQMTDKSVSLDKSGRITGYFYGLTRDLAGKN